MSIVEQALGAYNQAVAERDDAWERVEALTPDNSQEERDDAFAAFDQAQELVEQRKRDLERVRLAEEARQNSPVIADTRSVNASTASADTGNVTTTVAWSAVARGETREEATYRVDRVAEVSFLRDLYARKQGDREAAERLERNRREAIDALPAHSEFRDMSDTSTAGAEFVPTQYLAQLWVGPAVGGRPFADALPKLDLPTVGTTIDVPQLSSGVAVAARADAGAVQETDGVTATISHNVNEIAGQVDIGRIAVMRSNPPLDVIIGQTLVRRYNAYLDTQLLSGSGSSSQHDGLDNVSGINSVSYTDASPTAAELVPKLYDAIQQVWDGRKGESTPDLIVVHPRRGAWLASNLSSTFPLFQLGGLNQAAGSQAAGFVNNFAGLRVILDPNILTTYSAGGNTNEDRIYVVASEDYILMEGPMFARVFDDVGSGNGLIRYQVFAHSAFLSNRYPEGAALIVGTGLVAPTF